MREPETGLRPAATSSCRADIGRSARRLSISQKADRRSDTDDANGPVNDIAGLQNARGNVLGMMPRPDRTFEAEPGSADDAVLFQQHLRRRLRRVVAGPLMAAHEPRPC